MTDQATPLTLKAEALVAKHVRGDWTEGGWADAADGLDCRLCGDWCEMPDTLRAIEAAAARRAIEGSGARVASLEAALDTMLGFQYEHGQNCFVAAEVECVCGLDAAVERVMDVRLNLAAIPRPEEVEP